MSAPLKYLQAEQFGDVLAIRLQPTTVAVDDLDGMLAEVEGALSERGCKKLVFSLGPDEPLCLYSVFLAKLVSLQRRLQNGGGGLKIAEASADVQEIFEACRLHSFFEFIPDRAAAIAAFGPS
jgi:hypothetical protein